MNKINSKFQITNSKNGFTILYAVLVATVLLSIGLSTYNISSKQYILSSSSIDSQVAIYMADTGVECALYWDGKEAFATSTGSSGQPANIQCSGDSISNSSVKTSNSAVTEFQIDDTDGILCTNVKVTKELTGAPAYIKTTIESRGYNYCASNPRKVERALQVVYP